MSGPNQPSTVMSYIDSGVAAVQNAVGNLTGKVSSLGRRTCIFVLPNSKSVSAVLP